MSMTNLAFVVPGKPGGKERARSTFGGKRHYTPAKTAAYEGLVALAAQSAMGSATPFLGPLAVELEAVYAVPPSYPKKRRIDALSGLVWPASGFDLDNTAKAIFDGANGVVWADDKQIVHLTACKRYGERPEVRVRVAALGVIDAA